MSVLLYERRRLCGTPPMLTHVVYNGEQREHIYATRLGGDGEKIILPIKFTGDRTISNICLFAHAERLYIMSIDDRRARLYEAVSAVSTKLVCAVTVGKKLRYYDHPHDGGLIPASVSCYVGHACRQSDNGLCAAIFDEGHSNLCGKKIVICDVEKSTITLHRLVVICGTEMLVGHDYDDYGTLNIVIASTVCKSVQITKYAGYTVITYPCVDLIYSPFDAICFRSDIHIVDGSEGRIVISPDSSFHKKSRSWENWNIANITMIDDGVLAIIFSSQSSINLCIVDMRNNIVYKMQHQHFISCVTKTFAYG